MTKMRVPSDHEVDRADEVVVAAADGSQMIACPKVDPHGTATTSRESNDLSRSLKMNSPMRSYWTRPTPKFHSTKVIWTRMIPTAWRLVREYQEVARCSVRFLLGTKQLALLSIRTCKIVHSGARPHAPVLAIMVRVAAVGEGGVRVSLMESSVLSFMCLARPSRSYAKVFVVPCSRISEMHAAAGCTRSLDANRT